jgi:transcription antitermination factor NusG
MMSVQRTRGGRFADVREAVFPNYLFVETEDSPCQWRAVNGTRGVLRLLGSRPDGVPIPLRRKEIEELRRREEAGELRFRERQRIRRGDVVQFKHGALAGLVGFCQRTKRDRISVLLAFIGGATTLVQAPRSWLRPVIG